MRTLVAMAFAGAFILGITGCQKSKTAAGCCPDAKGCCTSQPAAGCGQCGTAGCECPANTAKCPNCGKAKCECKPEAKPAEQK